jgi:hypothetical protein
MQKVKITINLDEISTKGNKKSKKERENIERRKMKGINETEQRR